MASSRRVVVPNVAARWYSIAFWLIWAFGLYGVTATWPPVGWRAWAACLSLLLMPVLGVRALRARVVFDEQGFTSHDEIRIRRFSWGEVVGFRASGEVFSKVGVDLVSGGGWVGLPYHPFAADLVRQLEDQRAEFSRRS